MNWINDIQNSINFIENNLLENISADDVSKHVHSSPDYFQRTFHIVTGLSVSEYIRNRRLTLAGEELKNTQPKVIDVALKYGYDSPESFTKAFTRFHGITPASVKRSSQNLKFFCPLSVKVYIKGGFGMRRKIIPNIPDIDCYGSEVDYVFDLLDATFTGAGEKMSKAELAAYSGMANRFVWKPGAWRHGYEVMDSIDQTPFESSIRLFKTFGWDARYISILRDGDGKPLNTDHEQIRRDFVESIDKGYPVVCRMNSHRQNVVIGYENDGSIIVSRVGIDGENDDKRSETATRENWEDSVSEYILLKDKSGPAPERERFLDLLRLIVSRARRTDKINGMNVGFAAWEAYLHDLEFSDFSTLSLEEVGRDGRMGIYCDGLCQIWGRSGALPYYRSLAERFPEWRDELNIAAAALDDCSKYGGFLWAQGFSFDEKGYERFRDPAARKILADEGRKALQKDIEAVEQFEKILSKEGLHGEALHASCPK
ncbi:helix-turn-helix transcriptional regulator [Bacillota bacterium Meth-B3]